ncbi:MAG: hypothetical protein RL430_1541 [Actinomycetota bacterium]|jgi:hypothetical protein
MRTSNRRRPKSRKEIENLSDVAAWLYTDLLLGLVVVFIGGGAFKLISNTEPAGTTKGTQKLTHQLSCTPVEFFVPDSISSSSLDQITASQIYELQTRKAWTESKPGVVLIYGIARNTSEGGRDAKRFVDAVARKTKILKNAKMITGGEELGSRLDEIHIRIFVVYKGQVKDNGCLNN